MRSSRRWLSGFRVNRGGLRPGIALQIIFSSFFCFFLCPTLCSEDLWAQAAAQTAAPSAALRSIHGVVKSGNMPIPGAGVSATNAATNEQVNTWTDVDGSYALRIPADGNYSVRVQMAAFAVSAQEVALDPAHQDVQANFELVLLSRAREVRNEVPNHEAHGNAAGNNAGHAGGENPQQRANGGGRGFQSLSVFRADWAGFGRQFHERRCAFRDAGSGDRSEQRDRIRGSFGQHFQFVQFDER